MSMQLSLYPHSKVGCKSVLSGALGIRHKRVLFGLSAIAGSKKHEGLAKTRYSRIH